MTRPQDSPCRTGHLVGRRDRTVREASRPRSSTRQSRNSGIASHVTFLPSPVLAAYDSTSTSPTGRLLLLSTQMSADAERLFVGLSVCMSVVSPHYPPIYTVSQKTGATLTMAITSSILDRFDSRCTRRLYTVHVTSLPKHQQCDIQTRKCAAQNVPRDDTLAFYSLMACVIISWLM